MKKSFAIFLCGFLSANVLAQTPESRLFEALENNKPLVAEGIVARGAVNLDARDATGETPLHRDIAS